MNFKQNLILSMLSLQLINLSHASDTTDYSSAWTELNTQIQTDVMQSKDRVTSNGTYDGHYHQSYILPEFFAGTTVVLYPVFSLIVFPIRASMVLDDDGRVTRKIEARKATAKAKKLEQEASRREELNQQEVLKQQNEIKAQKEKFIRDIPKLKLALYTLSKNVELFSKGEISDAAEVKTIEMSLTRLAYNLNNNLEIMDGNPVQPNLNAMITEKIKHQLKLQNVEQIETIDEQVFAMKTYCQLMVQYLESIRERTEIEKAALLK